MSPQHDYVIDNSTGANVRSDINSVLQAIASNNSGSSDPSTTYAFQLFADTTNNVMKIRNAANNAFIELFQLDGTFTLEDGSASTPALAFRDDLNTGIFSSAADNIDISTGGTTRVNVSSTGINVTGTVIDDGATHDGDVTFTGDSANVVFDKSDNALEFADNAKATFGADADLTISHDGNNSIINDAGTGELLLQRSGNTIIAFTTTGIKVSNPTGDAKLEIQGFEANDAKIALIMDEGDDNGDTWEIFGHQNSQDLLLKNNVSGSFITKWRIDTNGKVEQDGQIKPTGDATAPALSFKDNGDAGFYSPTDNNIRVSIDGASKFQFGLNSFGPTVDDSKDLGIASLRWDDVRATNGSIVTSDKNEKNTITTSDLGLDFVNKLTPVSYKFNNKTRTHYGLIAQDIETLLSTLSKSATDFAGFCKDTITEDVDGNTLETPYDRYGLRYTEFIAPIIKAIQELSAKVTALESA